MPTASLDWNQENGSVRWWSNSMGKRHASNQFPHKSVLDTEATWLRTGWSSKPHGSLASVRVFSEDECRSHWQYVSVRWRKWVICTVDRHSPWLIYIPKRKNETVTIHSSWSQLVRKSHNLFELTVSSCSVEEHRIVVHKIRRPCCLSEFSALSLILACS